MPNRAPTLTAPKVTYRRLSEKADGQPASNGAAYGQGGLTFSPDGGRIAWVSFSDNFYAGDDYWSADIFVKDLASGLVTHVSTTAGGGALGYGDMPPGLGRGSFRPIFSPDGSKLLYSSTAINLVSGDTNGVSDLFVKDLVTGAVTRVSTDASGGQLNGASREASFSPDGSKIVFISAATNLVPGDANGVEDVFVKDLSSGAVTRVSTAMGGAEANGRSTGTPVFTSDGQVLFSSIANNLVAGDGNGGEDVFFKDLVTGAVTRISSASSGDQIQGGVYGAVLSPDGRKVAFVSSNPGLAAGDNSGADVFIKDLATGAVTRVAPPPSDGGYFYSSSDTPSNLNWSPNGEKLAFDMGAPYSSSSYPTNRHAYVYDLGTASLTHFTASAGFSGGGGGYGPVFSRDSNSIAFIGGSNAYVPTPANGFQYYLATFGGAAAPLSYREDSPAVALVTSIELRDDQSHFAGGSLNIAIGGTVAGDQLSIATGGSISLSGTTLSYNGSAFGILSGTSTDLTIAFNANATPAAVAALINAARYVHAGQDPTNAARTATFTLIDGGGTADGGADTAVLSRTINVTSVNDGPIGASRSFQMNSGETRTFQLSDFGYQDFDGDAFLSVNFGPRPQDKGSLFFDSDGPGGAAPVVFTGSTILASDIAAGRLSYAPGSFSGSADISFAVRDDGGTANGGVDVSGTNFFTFSVRAANVRPTVSTSAGSTNYVEGANSAAEVSVDPMLSFFDDRHPDGGAVTAATVRITGNYRPGEDLLKMAAGTFLPTTASWDASSGTLTIVPTGEISIENWQMLLRNIRYLNSSDAPDTAPRTISFQVSDSEGPGATATRTLTVTPVNDAPDLDLNGAASGTSTTRLYTEQAPAMAIAPEAVVADADSANFEGGQLSVRYVVPASEAGAQLDVLGLLHQGGGPGQVSVSGNVVSVGGVAIGTFSGGGGNTIPLTVTFNANADAPAVQAVLRAVSYYNGSDRPPASQSFEVRLTDGDGGTSAIVNAFVPIAAVDDPVLMDLNGAEAGELGALTFRIGSAATAIAPAARISDVDTSNFAGSILTLRLQGGRSGDIVALMQQGTGSGQIGVFDGNVVAYEGMAIGHLVGGGQISLDAQFVPIVALEALVRAVTFAHVSASPVEGVRNVVYELRLPGGVTTSQTAAVRVSATEGVLYGDAGDNILTGAQGNDVLMGMEGADRLSGGTGDDLLDGGAGADTMEGGADNDTYIVDDAGDIVTELVGEGTDEIRTGLASYSLLPLGNVENLTAASDVAHDFRGNAANNFIAGGGGNDVLRLQDGGDDTALGGRGNDLFFLGGALSSADSNDGGEGTDTLVLQGDYPALALSATSLVGIEGISLQSGTITRWGQDGTASYDYSLTTVDANVAAGQQLRVNAQSLKAGEDFTFTGAAETDGRFLVYGGFGVEVLTGGTGNDIFFFEAGRLGTGDRVDGGAGNDALVISGAAAGTSMLAATIASGTLLSIESLSVNGRFASDPAARPSYEIVLENGNIAPGTSLTVNGSSLTAAQSLAFDGSQVSDGRLTIFGGAGADTLKGGANADLIYAGGGGDMLTGGAGSDTFQLRSVSDSSGSGIDRITDFVSGTDKIDLSFLDADANSAGDQAFTFVGAAFSGNGTQGSGVAGELRAYQDSASGAWMVEGDVNGDGIADFQLSVTLASPEPLVGSDFIP